MKAIKLGIKKMIAPPRIIANPLIVLREEFNDQAVLFDPDSGAAYGVNRVGILIWSCLDGAHTVDDIRQELSTTFDRMSDQADRHIEEFIQELLTKGLATIVNSE